VLNKTLVFPVALEPRFKVVGTDLKIRFDGAKIPHRVWPREARGGRKSKFGPNIFVGSSLAVRGCKKNWRRSRLARGLSPRVCTSTPMGKFTDGQKHRREVFH
jgi:hypothetical protein